MVQGIFCALGASMIWGLIFVVPQFMEGFNSLEIVAGRYLAYGLISCFFFLYARKLKKRKYPLSIWRKALCLSLISTFGYYSFCVLSLRHASPAVCALILGISPITIAYYGNWKRKECSFLTLILPSLLIVAGLVMISFFRIVKGESPSTFLFGFLSGLICLGIWTWWVVANGCFLKNNPEIKSREWASLTGIATFFWATLIAVGLSIFHPETLGKFLNPGKAVWSFAAGCFVLGFFCSWIGTSLWNKASFKLPLSLMGQLNIFETIFGLLFVYMLEQRLPPYLECAGAVLLLGAVAYGIRRSRTTSQSRR